MYELKYHLFGVICGAAVLASGFFFFRIDANSNFDSFISSSPKLIDNQDTKSLFLSNYPATPLEESGSGKIENYIFTYTHRTESTLASKKVIVADSLISPHSLNSDKKIQSTPDL